MCNSKDFLLEYRDEPSALAGATSLGRSPGKGTARLQLVLEDGSNGAILNLSRVLYIPECPANLISQARLNDSGIHYNDETWRLYAKHSRETVGYAPRVGNNYVVKTTECPNIAVHLSFVEEDLYQTPPEHVHYTQAKTPLTIVRVLRA